MFICWHVALVLFFSRVFGIHVFPSGLNFIMMLNWCKRLLQVLNLPVYCRMVQDEHRTILENKPWTVQHLQQENWSLGFHYVVPLLIIGGFIIIISNLILQDACPSAELSTVRAPQCCCTSNIFPNLCIHQACAAVLKALGNFCVSLWMIFEFIFG